VIRNRMRIYQEETAPLITFYQNIDLLTTIDASQSPDAIAEVIHSLI